MNTKTGAWGRWKGLERNVLGAIGRHALSGPLGRRRFQGLSTISFDDVGEPIDG
jgi:hypothetical protein